MFHLEQNSGEMLYLYTYNLNILYSISKQMTKVKGEHLKVNNNSKHELYKLGSKLGLNKQDIESIIAEKPKNDALNLPFTVPENALDVYGIDGRYGTISKKDFQ